MTIELPSGVYVDQYWKLFYPEGKKYSDHIYYDQGWELYSCVPNKRVGPNKRAGWKMGQNKKMCRAK